MVPEIPLKFQVKSRWGSIGVQGTLANVKQSPAPKPFQALTFFPGSPGPPGTPSLPGRPWRGKEKKRETLSCRKEGPAEQHCGGTAGGGVVHGGGHFGGHVAPGALPPAGAFVVTSASRKHLRGPRSTEKSLVEGCSGPQWRLPKHGHTGGLGEPSAPVLPHASAAVKTPPVASVAGDEPACGLSLALGTERLGTIPWARCLRSLLWVLSADRPDLSHPENNTGHGYEPCMQEKGTLSSL